MTSKTLFLFFQTKIVEDASSQLSQSTGIYSSGHLISIEGAGQAVRGQRAGEE